MTEETILPTLENLLPFLEKDPAKDLYAQDAGKCGVSDLSNAQVHQALWLATVAEKPEGGFIGTASKRFYQVNGWNDDKTPNSKSITNRDNWRRPALEAYVAQPLRLAKFDSDITGKDQRDAAEMVQLMAEYGRGDETLLFEGDKFVVHSSDPVRADEEVSIEDALNHMYNNSERSNGIPPLGRQIISHAVTEVAALNTAGSSLPTPVDYSAMKGLLTEREFELDEIGGVITYRGELEQEFAVNRLEEGLETRKLKQGDTLSSAEAGCLVGNLFGNDWDQKILAAYSALGREMPTGTASGVTVPPRATATVPPRATATVPPRITPEVPSAEDLLPIPEEPQPEVPRPEVPQPEVEQPQEQRPVIPVVAEPIDPAYEPADDSVRVGALEGLLSKLSEAGVTHVCGEGIFGSLIPLTTEIVEGYMADMDVSVRAGGIYHELEGEGNSTFINSDQTYGLLMGVLDVSRNQPNRRERAGAALATLKSSAVELWNDKVPSRAAIRESAANAGGRVAGAAGAVRNRIPSVPSRAAMREGAENAGGRVAGAAGTAYNGVAGAGRAAWNVPFGTRKRTAVTGLLTLTAAVAVADIKYDAGITRGAVNGAGAVYGAIASIELPEVNLGGSDIPEVASADASYAEQVRDAFALTEGAERDAEYLAITHQWIGDGAAKNDELGWCRYIGEDQGTLSIAETVTSNLEGSTRDYAGFLSRAGVPGVDSQGNINNLLCETAEAMVPYLTAEQLSVE